MTIKDFVGIHTLTGVELNRPFQLIKYGFREDTLATVFQLDGINYIAIIDPDDGYRSYLCDELETTDQAPRTTFPPIEVFAKLNTRDMFGDESEVLELYDIRNSKLIFMIGTENVDDYYPCAVSAFYPENIGECENA